MTVNGDWRRLIIEAKPNSTKMRQRVDQAKTWPLTKITIIQRICILQGKQLYNLRLKSVQKTVVDLTMYSSNDDKHG